MTIPEDTPSGSDAPGPETPSDPRVRRPELERDGPNRGPTPPPGGSPPLVEPDTDPSISESISEAVKQGYDVLAETIEQGRAAAKRFRQGRYNMREVPGDLEAVGLRVLQLARELSISTFDICERLLKELGSQPPSPDPAAGIPPFHPASAKPAPPAAPPAADLGLMKLTVRFGGAARASTPTSFLARPQQPTSAADIAAEPLTPRSAGPPPLMSVNFASDLAVPGLIAEVTVPDGQPPGVYSGLVYAKGQDAPLGVLTVAVAP